MNDTDVKELFAAAVARPDLDRIDIDGVLRGGRRRQRVRTTATVGSVAAVLVLAGSLVANSTRPPEVFTHTATSPAATSVAPSSTPTPQPRSPMVTAAVGEAVAVGDTGMRLRLSAKGFCEESASGADVPLGPCRTVGDPNDPTGEGISRGAWAHVQVLTGLAPAGTLSVEAAQTDGNVAVGTLVHAQGATWVAYYVILPWTPGAVVDASHPPSSDMQSMTFITGTSRTVVPLGRPSG